MDVTVRQARARQSDRLAFAEGLLALLFGGADPELDSGCAVGDSDFDHAHFDAIEGWLHALLDCYELFHGHPYFTSTEYTESKFSLYSSSVSSSVPDLWSSSSSK